MVQLGPQCSAAVQRKAAKALSFLAINDVNQVKIAAAGAIPPLVALLGAQNSGFTIYWAASTLQSLALNTANRVLIRSAGGVTALNQLIQSTADEDIRSAANGALDAVNVDVPMVSAKRLTLFYQGDCHDLSVTTVLSMFHNVTKHLANMK